MIRLNLSNAPRWIDLGQGVRVEVLPYGTSLLMAASQDLRPEGDADHPVVNRADFGKAVARRAIVAWEGVADEGGVLIEPSPNAINALMEVAAMFLAFEQQYLSPAKVVLAEGNA